MKYILPYIFLAFLVFSCNKDEHQCKQYTPGQDVPAAPSLSSYRFKENSYWVYKNDATNQLDSQRVESAFVNNWISGGGSSTCSGATSFHEYRMRIKSFLTNESFDYYIIAMYLYKDYTFQGRFAGKYIFNNLNSFPPESGLEQLEIIPSLVLNGNTIQNVKKIRIKHIDPTASSPNPNNLSSHDLHYYFADSIGLVKWEAVDGSTVLESWSLQSWEVFL